MKIRLLSIVFIATLLAMTGVSVRAVQAQDASANQEQELEQETTTVCTTSGAYGQDQRCEVTTKQRGKQKQEIVFRKRVLGTHQVVNTALDVNSVAMILGLVALGSAATYGFIKTRSL